MAATIRSVMRPLSSVSCWPTPRPAVAPSLFLKMTLGLATAQL
jgi:hypothetical protein